MNETEQYPRWVELTEGAEGFELYGDVLQLIPLPAKMTPALQFHYENRLRRLTWEQESRRAGYPLAVKHRAYTKLRAELRILEPEVQEQVLRALELME